MSTSSESNKAETSNDGPLVPQTLEGSAFQAELASASDSNGAQDETQSKAAADAALTDNGDGGVEEKPKVEGSESGTGTGMVARSPLADDIEREASQHLARRAAEMSEVHGEERSNVQKQNNPPASPPAPTVPEKDSLPSKQQQQEADFDEKHPPINEELASNVPEAPKDTSEATGEEIQNIIDQFQNGMGGMGEDEIMSPVLERQQPLLVLPPRTSSLDHRAMSPQTTGGSVSSQPFSPDSARKPPSISGSSFHKVKSDDTESITSTKAGSIFQPPPPSPDPEPALPFDFHRFLEQLRHRTADPVARFLRSFLNEFGKKQWMVHEQVKIIADFLEFIAKKMAQCEVWRTVSDAEFDNAKEGMEKLVMNRLYSQTFSPAIPPVVGSPRKTARGGRSAADMANPHGPGRRGQHQEDVERDDVIAQKIRIYGWVREEHLDMKPINEKGRKFLNLAQQELLKIDTYRAPRDKVICVLNCCKVIFGFLRNAKADQSADAFVPLLIHTVLKAHPEHLVSNVQYIWRFRNQEKLGGEAGYYMSSLMGVVNFIENMDRTTLTITDEEFEKEVEQAVSAIAEKDRAEEYEEMTRTTVVAAPMQRLSEKSAISQAEVTPRNSMDAEQSSPRRNATRRLSEKSHQASTGSNSESDDYDAVTGLLRTIQKPLSSIGRIFSEDSSGQLAPQSHLRPASTPLSGSTPRSLSPAPPLEKRPSADGRVTQQGTPADAAARQASAEAKQAQRVRAQEHKVVVETLQSMFPNLDKEVIEDVVRAQEGNVGRAVDACLAMSGGGT